MNARDKILSAIRQNKPDQAADTEMQILPLNDSTDLVDAFCQMLERVGGRVVRTKGIQQISQDLEKSRAGGLRIINTISEIGPVNEIDPAATASSLSDIETTYLRSNLAVSENGAVWLSDKEVHNRLLPFISQHLTILLRAADLVANMHEAYSKISGVDTGFHVFIAGPSKTADIEQSLVIGAHGPRSTLIYLME